MTVNKRNPDELTVVSFLQCFPSSIFIIINLMEIISNLLALFSFKFDQFFLKVLLAINDVEKFKKK